MTLFKFHRTTVNCFINHLLRKRVTVCRRFEEYSTLAIVVNTRYNSNALLITNYFWSNFYGNYLLSLLK
jgi:hypothetical protein